MLMAIFGLTYDANATVAKDAVLSLINLTAEEAGAIKVFELAKQVQPVSRVHSDPMIPGLSSCFPDLCNRRGSRQAHWRRASRAGRCLEHGAQQFNTR